MAITIRNSESKEIYGTVGTLSKARTFCDQRLLKVSKGKEGFLSDLAAGVIEVHDSRAMANYFGPGF